MGFLDTKYWVPEKYLKKIKGDNSTEEDNASDSKDDKETKEDSTSEDKTNTLEALGNKIETWLNGIYEKIKPKDNTTPPEEPKDVKE